mmetsp:Transcript_14554/g.45054  ORF Transcript_14554/g.45054 Transcript_14554/m.45054 type:complete len:405 (-) Transcript_14554:246-1460(-)
MGFSELQIPRSCERERDDVNDDEEDERERPAAARAVDLLGDDVAEPGHVAILDGGDALLHGVAHSLLERRDALRERVLDIRHDLALERVDAPLAAVFLPRELLERDADVVVDRDHLVLEVVLQVLEARDERVQLRLDPREAVRRDALARREERRRARAVRVRGSVLGRVRGDVEREDVVVVGELARRRGHAEVRAPQPRGVERGRQRDARALDECADVPRVERDHGLERVAIRAAAHDDARARRGRDREIRASLVVPHVARAAGRVREERLGVARAVVDDDRDVLVEAQRLRVLERVEDDADAAERLGRAVEVAGAMRARVRQPEREAVAVVLLPLARDAELERRADFVDASGRGRPESAPLGLAIRRQPHEVRVHRGRAARAPAPTHDAIAARAHVLERRGEG